MNASADDSPTYRAGSGSCPAPIRHGERVTMSHGGGGRMTADLIDQVFAPEFASAHFDRFADATVVPLDGTRMALSTDTYVVQPLFFPGGDIGQLAVHGTINDLAMSGATPKYLTAGFVIEEGFLIADLRRIAVSMGQAATRAGVAIVAGDTKVVERGHGDGVYINTAGVGTIDRDVKIHPAAAQPGDAVLLSGPLGNHGMAILSVREGLEFESTIRSDTADLSGLVATMRRASDRIRVMRDPTRGGLAASLNEIASASRVGIELEESRIPIDDSVGAACEFLGIDPLHVANEGKLVACVDAADAAAVLAAMRAHRLGRLATRIGQVIQDDDGWVVAKTELGANRVVPVPMGEQLPRIC